MLFSYTESYPAFDFHCMTAHYTPFKEEGGTKKSYALVTEKVLFPGKRAYPYAVAASVEGGLNHLTNINNT